jgi:DASH complex subunit SPC19
LQEYKTELADSLVPQINTLVERAEEVIQRDERKMKSLEERVSLSHAYPSIVADHTLQCHTQLAIIRSNKTSSDAEPSTSNGPQQSAFPTSSATPAFDTKALNPAQRRKMVILKGKRERLERELARMG